MERDTGHGGGHGLLHMLLGCGLVLVAALAFGAAGGPWAVPLLLVVLLACPLMMLGGARAAEGGRWWAPWRKGGGEGGGNGQT